MAESTEESSSQRRKVLDDPALSGETFDEEILAEIEGRLEDQDGGPALPEGAGDKVELDKADLPLDLTSEVEEPEPEVAPEIEVDLAGDEPEDIHLEEEEEKPARRFSPLVLAAGGLVLVLAAAGVGWWAFSPATAPEEPENKLPPYIVTGPVPDINQILRLKLKPFIIPLQDTDQGRILKIAVSLETPDEEARQRLSQNLRLCRDVIYRLLRNRPAKELKSARSKRLLQAQIKTELNHALKGKMVFQVYFTEFVITG